MVEVGEDSREETMTMTTTTRTKYEKLQKVIVGRAYLFLAAHQSRFAWFRTSSLVAGGERWCDESEKRTTRAFSR